MILTLVEVMEIVNLPHPTTINALAIRITNSKMVNVKRKRAVVSYFFY